ncbi:hypothetical protein [Alienimonas californiensis]|uniref:Lipoprotein n=1 Tax=Alienimonas californiensis TaxID=2527989 RepID=A0A517P8Z8_9PLAN|nr:hypothetical protein [Alienimonas californiensis]QDT15837.1 hypothetical protein CA12_19320 [Alienimonas californiensis]
MRPHLPLPDRRVPRRAGAGGRSARRQVAWAALLSLAVLTAFGLPGCKPMIMLGKMLTGDPTVTPPFEAVTDVDLTKGGHTVLVLARSPELVKARFPEVDQEIMRRVGRRLHSAGAEIANSDRVLDWVEGRGGVWSESHLGSIAQEFDVDYIIVVELDRFDWHEQHSPDLLRGRSAGWIRAYSADAKTGDVGHIMGDEFESVYPKHRPESAGSVSTKVFRERYLDRLCEQATQRFIPFTQQEMVH